MERDELAFLAGRSSGKSKGLRDQMEELNTEYYNDFSLDTLVDYCMKLSTPKQDFDDGRRYVMVCNKKMAIESYLTAYKYTEPTDEEVEEYRIMLEDNLEDGLYRIDSGSIDNFITYLGRA